MKRTNQQATKEHRKEEIIDGLLDVYNNNSLQETDECAILNALDYLGYDIQMI
jgi:hypothetical protein